MTDQPPHSCDDFHYSAHSSFATHQCQIIICPRRNAGTVENKKETTGAGVEQMLIGPEGILGVATEIWI